MQKTRRRKMTVDVDEGNKAEEQSGFLAQLRAILNVLPVYTWYGNPSGSLLFVSNRQADFLGIPKDHPLRFGVDIGAQWDDWIPLLHPDEHEEARKYWSNCLRTGEAASIIIGSVTLKATIAGSSRALSRSGQAMEPCCYGLGLLWISKSSSALGKDCGRADTSSVKSSRRCLAWSG
jgi:hypothetical protein